VYQPIVDVHGGRFLAYEALVRCRHPLYNNPAALFRAASEQRSCGHLGRVIRQVAFARCDSKPLFVNVHPDELSSRWLVRPDDPMGFHGHDVYLEITETAAFTHFDLCMGVLKEVCNRTGAHLVVDDFGAGHSNMQRVMDLRPAIVKLDGALIRNLHRDKRRQILVKHVVDLCTDLGAKVVAECVETVEELKAARDLGAHFAQGFLLAKPDYPAPAAVWPLRSSRRPSSPPTRRSTAPARRSPARGRTAKSNGARSTRPPRGR
jgi:EAL domain-containing protein (putative c-di-GMP-specific phosphodiesterase class I)